MIQYKWIIEKTYNYSSDNLNKIISLVYWKREARIIIDAEKKDEYSVFITEHTALPTPSEDSFINYNEVTDEDLSNWLDIVYGSDYKNEDLKIMLEAEMNKEEYIK
jgi:hypothetical protein